MSLHSRHTTFDRSRCVRLLFCALCTCYLLRVGSDRVGRALIPHATLRTITYSFDFKMCTHLRKMCTHLRKMCTHLRRCEHIFLRMAEALSAPCRPSRPSFSKSRSETEIFVSGAMVRINGPDSVARAHHTTFSTAIVSPRSSSILHWRPPRWPYRSAVSKRGEVSFCHRVAVAVTRWQLKTSSNELLPPSPDY